VKGGKERSRKRGGTEYGNKCHFLGSNRYNIGVGTIS